MTDDTLYEMSPHEHDPSAARHARRRLKTDHADISRSWQRCRQAGLMPERRSAEAPRLDGAALRHAAQRRATLLHHARPVMSAFYQQIRDSGCIMLVSDGEGYVLDAQGDNEFCNRAARVALEPGANWAEAARGNNAVGTALAENRPIVIHGAEHYLRDNSFLACAAAPLAQPDGSLLGVINLSCDARQYHPHTFGLVRAAAQMIESRMFESAFRAHRKIRFQITGISTMFEGAIALSDDEQVIGLNRPALDMLGAGPFSLAALFGGKSLEELARLSRPAKGAPFPLRLANGALAVISLEPSGPVTSVARPKIPEPDALSQLDTGDARLASAVKQVRRALDRPIAILLHGETGAGKDVFARAIHAASARRDRGFVAVNCAALPETLIEAELFGYAPGSFTGARREGAMGRIREADGGTLFLDEIGDMPMLMQTRLLRVLEDQQVTPLGGKACTVDFQLISATHCDFKARIAAQQFRADLFYRLNGLMITLPPLRDRTDFDALLGRILGRVRVAPSLAAALRRYAWPGNLRELASMMRAACAMLDEHEDELDWQHVSPDAVAALSARPSEKATRATLRAHSDAVIAETLAAMDGNITAAAKQLGVSRNTLYRRINVR
jgi:transcriptional regulator of acetoin/glycerol metabolism